MNRRSHEAGRVEGDDLRNTLREGLGELGDAVTYRVGDLERVASRLQEHRDAHRGLAVEIGECVIAHRAEVDTRDVANAQRAAGAARAQENIAEIGGVQQSPPRSHGVDQRLPGRRRLGAYLAGGILIVLGGDGLRDIGRGHAELRHFRRIEPHAHRVVARAEDRHIGDTRDALELVEDVDRRVVAEIERIVAGIIRCQRDHQQDVGRSLLRNDTGLAHDIGQARERDGDPVVDVDHRLVAVRAHLERAVDRQRAVGRRRRAEVDQVLDTRKLLLDRRGDGERQRLGAGAGIVGRDHDRRRRDFRILRHRQHLRGNQSRERDDDRDDAGENRPVDEEFRKRHRRGPICCRSWPMRSALQRASRWLRRAAPRSAERRAEP